MFVREAGSSLMFVPEAGSTLMFVAFVLKVMLVVFLSLYSIVL